jgi:2-amino-4-hydroxy-6-hydroxymethyldihydropteridine diphosphokinase
VTLALVALGGNVEPRRRHLLGAVTELDTLPATRVLGTSRLHETAPVGCPPGSGAFLNGACLLETELSPHALLAELLAIEVRHGRRRGAPNAPRTLDLDLLLVGDACIDTPELVLPHPRLHERAFVLVPLAELAAEAVHPRLGLRIGELLARLPDRRGVQRYAPEPGGGRGGSS